MGDLLSLSYEKNLAVESVYKDSKYDENGWTFTTDHWYNIITNEKVKSSPYELSDDEAD